MSPTRTLTLLASLTGALLIAAPTVPAGAVEADLQHRIEQVLLDFPGGVQTGPNEVTWGGGDVVLTIADSETAAQRASIGSCPSGAHCVFSGAGLGGSKLTFNTCTTQSVAPLGGPVRSIANARASEIVRAYNDVGAVGSVSPGAWLDTNWQITKIGC